MSRDDLLDLDTLDDVLKRGPGRPRLKVDEDLIERLGRIGATLDEAALVTGVSADTIRRRGYCETLKKGLTVCKMSVRRQLLRRAMQGDAPPALLIFASKVFAGLREDATDEEPAGLPWD
jgi:hypothetical protein